MAISGSSSGERRSCGRRSKPSPPGRVNTERRLFFDGLRSRKRTAVDDVFDARLGLRKEAHSRRSASSSKRRGRVRGQARRRARAGAPPAPRKRRDERGNSGIVIGAQPAIRSGERADIPRHRSPWLRAIGRAATTTPG
jgi:hypothetical protein